MDCFKNGCLGESQLTQTMHRGKGDAMAIYISALTSVTQFESYCARSETWW